MQFRTKPNQLNTVHIKAFIAFFLIFSIHNLKAQEQSCAQSLVDAQEVYASGRIEEVPAILETCLQNGFNKQERVAAYRLLTLCHLYYNRTVEASKTMQELLSIMPEYKIQDIDPSEFINLHSTFRTTPLLIIGAKGGFGGFNFYETTNYNDINSSDYTGTYKPQIALMGGISIEVPIMKELSIVTEFFYNTYKYKFERTVLDYASIKFTEKVTGIEVPLMVQWNIRKNKQAIPYINAGTSMYYILSSEGNIDRNDVFPDEPTRQAPLGTPVDLTASRNKLNFSIAAGAGVRIKDFIGTGYLTIDMRYSRYMKNHVEENKRAEFPNLSYSYLYTDNSFKLENLQFLLGYKLPLYFPRQRKTSRPEQ